MAASFRFTPRVCELDPSIEPGSALARLGHRRMPILIDSPRGEPRRWSLLAFDPLPPAPEPSHGVSGLRAIHFLLARASGDDVPGPFHGGLLAALSYDLGVEGERPIRCAPEPWKLPLAIGGLYTDFLVRDEELGRTWLVLGDEPGDSRSTVAERRAAIESELAGSREAGSSFQAGALSRSVSVPEHVRRIERARAHIAVGDIYQVNLAHRFTCSAHGSPVGWYLRLREANPAPYMGFASWTEADRAGSPGAILSASPELLLEFDGSLARTRPIKGTAARAQDPGEDHKRREALLASAKDRAELAMIVDLERNDLGRIAEPGQVWVERWPRLESYARVHHLMADVVAKPRQGFDAFDMLAALFPGGSITGAPKLRAMELIAELEQEGRGFFTGTLGFVDTRGRCAFNVLIRTFLWRPHGGGELSFRVGGGITWSSDAEAEDRETLDKAAGMIDALIGAR